MKNNHATRISIGFIAGVLFSFGMIISTMVDPKIVIAFLDITGAWDPSLAFVMIGALMVFMPFYHYLIKPREAALDHSAFKLSHKNSIDRRLIIGAICFGLGWGMAGICPGPAITSISGGSFTILMFMIAMMMGMKIANKYFPQ